MAPSRKKKLNTDKAGIKARIKLSGFEYNSNNTKKLCKIEKPATKLWIAPESHLAVNNYLPKGKRSKILEDKDFADWFYKRMAKIDKTFIPNAVSTPLTEQRRPHLLDMTPKISPIVLTQNEQIPSSTHIDRKYSQFVHFISGIAIEMYQKTTPYGVCSVKLARDSLLEDRIFADHSIFSNNDYMMRKRTIQCSGNVMFKEPPSVPKKRKSLPKPEIPEDQSKMDYFSGSLSFLDTTYINREPKSVAFDISQIKTEPKSTCSMKDICNKIKPIENPSYLNFTPQFPKKENNFFDILYSSPTVTGNADLNLTSGSKYRSFLDITNQNESLVSLGDKNANQWNSIFNVSQKSGALPSFSEIKPKMRNQPNILKTGDEPFIMSQKSVKSQSRKIISTELPSFLDINDKDESFIFVKKKAIKNSQSNYDDTFADFSSNDKSKSKWDSVFDKMQKADESFSFPITESMAMENDITRPMVLKNETTDSGYIPSQDITYMDASFLFTPQVKKLDPPELSENRVSFLETPTFFSQPDATANTLWYHSLSSNHDALDIFDNSQPELTYNDLLF